MEHTLALIKPDAVKAGTAAEMQQLVELAGFQVIAKQQLQLTRHTAECFYDEHRGKPFFAGLVEFMTGPIVALVLARPGAIRAWRELMGPTDAREARVKAPKSMRALYGSNGTQNAAHGSDSPASAAREIKFFFPSLQLSGPPADPSAHEGYIKERLQPTLLKALSALAREKPSSNPQEAATFLGHWLLANNPAKPRIAVPEELQAQQLAQAAAVAAEATAAAEAAAAAHAAAAARSARGKVAGRLAAPAAAAGGGGGGSGSTPDEASLQNAAATKVQACFRGYQTRKHMGELRAGAGAEHADHTEQVVS